MFHLTRYWSRAFMSRAKACESGVATGRWEPAFMVLFWFNEREPLYQSYRCTIKGLPSPQIVRARCSHYNITLLESCSIFICVESCPCEVLFYEHLGFLITCMWIHLFRYIILPFLELSSWCHSMSNWARYQTLYLDVMAV